VLSLPISVMSSISFLAVMMCLNHTAFMSHCLVNLCYRLIVTHFMKYIFADHQLVIHSWHFMDYV